MKLLGFELRRVPPPDPDPQQQMMDACDAMNDAWSRHRADGGKTRPWVIWEEQRVVLTQYNGDKVIIHE